METVRDIFLIGVMLAFVTSLLAGFYFSIRTGLNRRRPSKRGFVHTNPLNALFFEDELLPEGLRYRAKAFWAFLIAFISIFVAFALG
ncbi:MAG TPA: hypothetical protein VNK51_23815 [Bradyrhizobium sp.]|nr:hypothetical protein [Bradyrhizobium sp.]